MQSGFGLRLIAAGAALVFVLVPSYAQRGGSEAESFLERKERWAIKTGADPGAKRIRLNTARVATVADLIRLPRPVELPENASTRSARTTRYSDAERRLFTIDADIVRYKLENDDHDFHVVIRDHGDAHAEDAPADSGDRRTMIVEFPDPAVVLRKSPWRKAIAAARADFESHFSPQPRFAYQVVHARVTGVGYFDFIHGQSGVAANGIELHPILKIEVLDQTETPTPVAARMHRDSKYGGTVRSGGKVWVNLNSGVYWRPGTEYYGTTKHGKYMTEREALKAGYRAAKDQ